MFHRPSLSELLRETAGRGSRTNSEVRRAGVFSYAPALSWLHFSHTSAPNWLLGKEGQANMLEPPGSSNRCKV